MSSCASYVSYVFFFLCFLCLLLSSVCFCCPSNKPNNAIPFLRIPLTSSASSVFVCFFCRLLSSVFCLLLFFGLLSSFFCLPSSVFLCFFCLLLSSYAPFVFALPSYVVVCVLLFLVSSSASSTSSVLWHLLSVLWCVFCRFFFFSSLSLASVHSFILKQWCFVSERCLLLVQNLFPHSVQRKTCFF